MTGRFLIKEIAVQAGVSMATVDRVLNGRAGVRPRTVERVQGAIQELEFQSARARLRGKRLVVDLLAEAPRAFLDPLGDAANSSIAFVQSAVVQVRRDLRRHFPAAEFERAMLRILRRGSGGVIVMGPASEPVRRGVDRLEAAGVPVVTLASDIPSSARRAYVGLDNHKGGEVAAWFLSRVTRTDAPNVIVTIRNDQFHGEGDRATGFRRAMARHFRAPQVAVLVEGAGRHDIADKLAAQLAAAGELTAIYSIGGHNLAIFEALDRLGTAPEVFIGHDLNPENAALLRAGRIDLVLYHDLGEDLRAALQIIVAIHEGAEPVASPGPGSILRAAMPPMLA